MREPIWSCSLEGDFYELEAVASHGVFRCYARHMISKSVFNHVICQRVLLESAIECMMDQFRKMAWQNGPAQEKLGEWPKQKYALDNGIRTK